MRYLLVLALLWPASAWSDELTDAAIEALAKGRSKAAVKLLRRALDGNGSAENRCRLGRALLRAGQPREAAKMLAQVPLAAKCGRRAAFDRADALQAAGDDTAAAALYADAGAPLLGPDRDLETADWLQGLVARLDAEHEGPSDTANGLLRLALNLRTTGRAKIARQLLRRGAGDLTVVQTLIAEVPEPNAEDLRLMAAGLSPRDALAVVADLPAEASTFALRGKMLLRGAPEHALRIWADTARRFPKSDAAREARKSRVQALVSDGRYAEAKPELAAMLDGPDGAQASAWLANAQSATGDEAAALKTLTEHRTRFPRDPARATVESARVALRERLLMDEGRRALSEGRAAAAAEPFDQLANEEPRPRAAALASFEAGLGAYRAGDREKAKQRWLEAAARWPEHAAAALRAVTLLDAIDASQPKAAMRRLAESPIPAASALRDELQTPELLLSTRRQLPGRDAKVQVHVRNIEWVEASVYRIDAEAFVRAGGRVDTLPELDVAVVAPDRRWKVKVPRYAPFVPVDFDLAVPGLKPGLYMITVASPTSQATAVLWISDLSVVARAAGQDVVLAAFDRDGPVRADVWMVGEGEVETGRTSGRGLYRATAPDGALTLLAIADGSPALVTLNRGARSAEPTLRLDAELELPVYRSGDTVRFRMHARKDGAPVAASFKYWLADGNVRYAAERAKTNDLGTLVGAVDLPPIAQQGRSERRLTLQVLAPGEDTPRTLTSIRVKSVDAAGVQLALEMDGRDALVRATDADGGPVAVAIEWSASRDGEERRVVTGADGKARLKGPRLGLPWSVSARVVGGETRYRVARRVEGDASLVWLRVPAVVEPNAPAELRLGGPDGPVRVQVMRLEARPDPRAAPEDPWPTAPALDFLAAESPTIAEAPSAIKTPVQTIEGTIADDEGQVGSTITLPGLAPGWYALRALAPAGNGRVATATIRVSADQPRFRGVRDVAVGERLQVGFRGGPALLTVERDGIVAARIAGPKETLDWTPNGRWTGDVQLRATLPDGATTEAWFTVHDTIEVELTSTFTDAGWQVEAALRDTAGRPVRGEVLLTAVDRRLADSVGASKRVSVALFERAESGLGAVGSLLRRIRHTVAAEAIDDSLLAEAKREEEDRRAAAARSGSFGKNKVAQVILDEVPIEGGLGMSGSGRGGGGMGYGRGAGRAGIRGGQATISGFQPARGVRDSVLWAVARADREGRARITVPRPPAARWTVRAVAVGERGHGVQTLGVDAAQGLRLVVPEPGSGRVGDVARLDVTVVNSTDAAATVTVTFGGAQKTTEVGAGQAQGVDLGTHGAGVSGRISLSRDGVEIEGRSWAFPLAGQPPHEDGRAVTVALAPGGGFGVDHLALREDDSWQRDAQRAAVMGRGALAAADATTGARREALLSRARAARAALRTRNPTDTREAAEVLLFLAQAKGALGVTRGEIERIAKTLTATGATVDDRLAIAHARAAAGEPVDASIVARLSRQTLSDEQASRLARIHIALGDPKAAREFVRGDGAHAVLARGALKQDSGPARTALRKTAPPAAGHTDAPDWIAAAAGKPGKSKGAATITVDGAVVGKIDLRSGGALTVASKSGAVKVTAGDPLVYRGDPAPPTGSVTATRAPLGGDGRPLWLPGAWVDSAGDHAVCGDPCVLRPGEALHVLGDISAVGWQPPGGLALEHGAGGTARWLRATTPGKFVLIGPPRPDHDPGSMVVEVRADAPLRVAQRYALALAEQRKDLATLAPWPADDAWPPEFRARRARLRFTQALAGEETAQEIVERFEALREASPTEGLTFDQVAAVAAAYAAHARPGRAIDVWRAGLGAAFLAEAASVRQVEDLAGPLASLQGLYALGGRYPAVDAVRDAFFHLPQRLGEMAQGDLSIAVEEAGITATDLRLMAAAWDREYLAWWPGGRQRLEVGIHLVSALQRLRADEQAASWAAALAKEGGEDPLLDSVLYLQALSHGRLRQDAKALAIYERIATEEFPRADGTTGPAASRPDARYAAARLYDARGELERAKAAYKDAAANHPEAARAVAALETVRLEPEPVVRISPRADADIPIFAANLDKVGVRAYRIDLRTLFVRDQGLGNVAQVQVSGVNPTWSGTRSVEAGSFPSQKSIELPLDDRGAYLIQLDGGGSRASLLLVRSDLLLDLEDDGSATRVRVRDRAGDPVAGAGLRAAVGGGIKAGRTDVRGVALFPTGASVLAFKGDDYAFSAATSRRVQAPPSPGLYNFDGDSIDGNIDNLLEQQMQRNKGLYEKQFKKQAVEKIEANML